MGNALQHTTERITFAAAARELRVHVSTLHRWRQQGIDGEKLHASRLGGRWYVTPEALADFERRLSSEDQGPEVPPHRTEAVAAGLDAAGIV